MGKHLETSIRIQAPAARIWQTLMDFKAYPDWNPFVIGIEGLTERDSKLRVKLQPPNGKTMTFRPRVVEYHPPRLFAWKGSLAIPGLFDGIHRFELEAVASDRTNLVHAEVFSGLLVPLIWNSMEAKTRAGFESMNEALKLRAESWESP